MVLKRSLRLLATTLVLFASLCGVQAARAADCSGGGRFDIGITPCPFIKTVVAGTSLAVSFKVNASANYSAGYVVVTGDLAVIKPGTFSAVLASSRSLLVQFNTPPGMGVGQHKGVLQVSVCGDTACKTLFATATLPVEFDVDVPPALTELTPSSSTEGTGVFTLKLTGRFTPGSQIHFGTLLPATKFVSTSELTAVVNLAAETKGQDYEVSVVAADGLSTGPKEFVLNNPVPIMNVVAPSAVTVGAGTIALRVTGKQFVSGSQIKFGTTLLGTSFVSRHVLTANVHVKNFAAGTYKVRVVSPSPHGGTSAAATFTLNNATPVITGISPSAEPLGAFFDTVNVTGTGFQENSQILIDGVDYSTNYVSSTSMTVQFPFDTFTSAGEYPVVVVTPSPGGGTSNSVNLEMDNPVPTVTWINPIQAYAGSGDMTLMLEGQEFNHSTQVQWNGVTLSAPVEQFNNGQFFLQVTVPAVDLAQAGTATVTVVNPGPGGGSAQASFNVMLHPPEIDSLSPGFIAPGGGDFTLTLNGVDFDATPLDGTAVYWNGQALDITQISSTQIQVTVPAAYTASAGVAAVTVINPTATGGASVPASFAVDPSGSAVVALVQPVNDIAWDLANFVFYGSTHAADAAYPDAIVAVDPVLGAVTTSASIGAEADLLSLSKDDQMLYASFSGAIRRFSLPGFTVNQTITVTNPALLQVSPTNAHVVAVANKINGATPSNISAVVWADSSLESSYITPTDAWDALGWSLDGTTLYGGDNEAVAASFMSDTYSILAFSQPVIQSTNHLWTGGPMHVDPASGLVYADDSTSVIDPVAKSITATLPISGVMIPDSSLGCEYFITQTTAQVSAGDNDYTLSCYSTTDQSLTRSLVIPSLSGTPTKMMRWGNEGLVVQTTTTLYFVSGQIVTGN
jgi:hypothetical protein